MKSNPNSNDIGNRVALEGIWKFVLDRGGVHGQRWADPKYDDSAWDNRNVPSYRPGAYATRDDFARRKQDLEKYRDFAWYRKRVLIPRQWQGKTPVLKLGRILSWETTYFNGVPLGSEDHPSQRCWPWDIVNLRPEYDVPDECIRWGRENIIAVRVRRHFRDYEMTDGPFYVRIETTPRYYKPNYEPRPYDTVFPKSPRPSREILVVPAQHNEDFMLTIDSLQGLVNRRKPFIMLKMSVRQIVLKHCVRTAT